MKAPPIMPTYVAATTMALARPRNSRPLRLWSAVAPHASQTELEAPHTASAAIPTPTIGVAAKATSVPSSHTDPSTIARHPTVRPVLLPAARALPATDPAPADA